MQSEDSGHHEPPTAPCVFVCYRRLDSADVVGRVCDRLITHFGRESVFLDVDDIPAGVHFPSRIYEVLARSNAVLVAIGPAWKSIADESGRRRLENSNDHVRVEIERSLALGIPVIPLLLGGNKEMPSAPDLPASIQSLAHMNGLLIRPSPDFDNDMRRLFSELETIFSSQRATPRYRTSQVASARRRIEDAVNPIGKDMLGYTRSFSDKDEEDATGNEDRGSAVYREGFQVGAIQGLQALRYGGAVVPDSAEYPTPNMAFFAMSYGEVWSRGFADGVGAAHRQIREEPLPFDSWATVRETAFLRRWWTAVPSRRKRARSKKRG